MTIDSVEWSDFTYLVNMLTAHDIKDFKLLSTIAIPMKLQRGRKDVARELIQLFVEIFVAQSDMSFAQNMLQTHISHTAIANDTTLLSYQTLFLVSQCTSFALAQKPGLTIERVVLSVDVLATRPIFFAHIVEVLHHMQDQSSSAGLQARRYLADLKVSFSRSADRTNENAIIHMLYVSYLHGIEKTDDVVVFCFGLSFDFL